MSIAQVVMWFGIVAFILLVMLAAYSPPTLKGKQVEIWLCLSGIIAIVAALSTIFWMP